MLRPSQNYIKLVFHINIFKIPFNKSQDTIVTSIFLKKKEKEKTEQRFLLSCIHLKYTIVISNNVHLGYNFCQISLSRTQNLHFPKNSRKIVTAGPPHQAILAKLISISSFKVSILHSIFFTIPWNRIRDTAITRTLGETGQQRPLLNYVYINYN